MIKSSMFEKILRLFAKTNVPPSLPLAIKLFVPPIPANYLERPRLERLHRQILAHKLTLVLAPAGYGKTTFVSRFLKECDSPVAWVSLDKHDNDFGQFWTNIILGIQKVSPGLGAHECQILIQNEKQYELALTGLINAIQEIIPDLVVVLSGYHYIDNKAIHDAVTFFMEYLPLECHLVIIAQRDPPLSLTRLITRNLLTKITADDLRFNQEETANYLKDSMGLSLTQEEVQQIHDKIEGWAAGLHMIALSLQSGNKEVLATLKEETTRSTEFLLREVIEPLDASLREFLMDTCVLEKFTAELCDAVTRTNNSRQKIQALIERNLFIEQINAKGEWYRYSGFFRKMLYKKLQESNPKKLYALHKKASIWYRDRDQFDDAIDHAINAYDYKHACKILSKYSVMLLERGTPLQAHDWLTRIPDENIANNFSLSVLALHVSWYPIHQVKPKEYYFNLVKSLSQRISQEGKIQDPAIFTSLAWLALYEANQIYITKGNAELCIELLLELLKRIPPDESMALCLVQSTLGNYHMLDGNLVEAENSLVNSKSIAIHQKYRILTLSAINRIACIRFSRGHLFSALEACNEAILLEKSERGNEDKALFFTYFVIANIYYQWNQIDQARVALEKAVELGEKMPDIKIPLLYALYSACLAKADGKIELALELARRARSMALQNEEYRFILSSLVDTFMTNLWLQIGNLATAKDYARSWSESIEEFNENLTSRETLGKDILNDLYGLSFGEYLIGRKITTYLRLKINAKEFDGLSDLFSILMREVKNTGWVSIEIEIHILRALFLHATQQEAEALEELNIVLHLTEQDNWIRVYLDEGLPMLNLLELANSRGFDSPQIQDLMSVLYGLIKTKSVNSAVEKALPLNKGTITGYYEPLTTREMEILKLIAMGMADKEVASCLALTIQTVRNYNHNIYGKLAVRNRTQAIQRVRELGLIQ